LSSLSGNPEYRSPGIRRKAKPEKLEFVDERPDRADVANILSLEQNIRRAIVPAAGVSRAARRTSSRIKLIAVHMLE